MTRTEIITRLCELASAMADLKGQAEQLQLETQQLIEEIQKTE